MFTMYLAEKKAIDLTIKLWDYLRQNPGKQKQDYPGYDKYDIGSMIADCPCCDYYRRGDLDRCDVCPIRDCTDDNSPWDLWFKALAVDDYAEMRYQGDVIYNRAKYYYDKKWGKL